MEKQPVDDLFARKLRDAEVAPGADVFGRLQTRMNATPLPVAAPKRRLAGWWYGVAASVLLSIAWLSWSRVGDTVKPMGHQVARAGNSAVQPTARNSESQPTGAQTDALTTGADASPETTQATERTTRPAKTAEYVAQANTSRENSKPTEQPTPKAPVTDNVPETVSVTPVEAPIVAKTEKIQPTVEVEKVPTGRTVVLTIADPEPVKLATVQPTKTDAVQNTPNLSQFFDKVKQIKSGEVFARATPTRPAAEPRTGLGRLVNGVRESLRNENSLEP
ncbi:hypothetical protein ACAW74_13460 [Fibrella sp. WM1]|uniref:hypothetical protein n=1 Tax=Fibrella musci TaxID=3242485 RepID=UPI003520F6EE